MVLGLIKLYACMYLCALFRHTVLNVACIATARVEFDYAVCM